MCIRDDIAVTIVDDAGAEIVGGLDSYHAWQDRRVDRFKLGLLAGATSRWYSRNDRRSRGCRIGCGCSRRNRGRDNRACRYQAAHLAGQHGDCQHRHHH